MGSQFFGYIFIDTGCWLFFKGCWLLKEARRASIWFCGQRRTTPPPSTYQGRWHEGACLFSPPEGAFDWGVSPYAGTDFLSGTRSLVGDHHEGSLHPRVKGLLGSERASTLLPFLQDQDEMTPGQGGSLVLQLDTFAETIGCIPVLRAPRLHVL